MPPPLASLRTALKSRLLRWWLASHPTHRGACRFPPGHFHSPLLDLDHLPPGTTTLPHDTAANWEHIDLQPAQQKTLYHTLLTQTPRLPFPSQPHPDWLYHQPNGWFPLADAFLLSGLIQHLRPQKIIEVGSGFSTAATLDTLDKTHASCAITCIEPHPQRLLSLLPQSHHPRITLLPQSVQTLDPAFFDQLAPNDILFIDSSHVAKAGSDVAFLFLRILPRLRPGVWVHIHDIFYPGSYPIDWFLEGRAWNESLFLRTFLLGNPGWITRAFNSQAAATFPDLLQPTLPEILTDTGGSFWMQRLP